MKHKISQKENKIEELKARPNTNHPVDLGMKVIADKVDEIIRAVNFLLEKN